MSVDTSTVRVSSLPGFDGLVRRDSRRDTAAPNYGYSALSTVSRQRSARRQTATVDPSSRYAFYALLALLFALAVGNLYALRGFTQLYLGLPLWVYLQIVVLAAMLAVAWAAVRIVTAGSGRTGTAESKRTGTAESKRTGTAESKRTGTAESERTDTAEPSSESRTGDDGPLTTGIEAPGAEPTDERDDGTEPLEDA